MLPLILVKQKLGRDEGTIIGWHSDAGILDQIACEDAGVKQLNWVNIRTGCVGYDNGFSDYRYLITVASSDQVLVD